MFTILQRSSIVSLLFRLTFIVLIAGICVQLYKKPWLNELHVYALLTICICFFHVSLKPTSLSISYYNKLIIFASSLLILPFIDRMTVNQKLVGHIFGINLCVALIYPLAYNFSSNPGYLANYLTLHFSNPNFLAMFILHSLLYCVLALFYYKNKLVRLGLLTLIGHLSVLINLTQARSCYVAIFCFSLFIIGDFFMGKNRRVSNKIILFCILLPLLIAIIYLNIIENDVFYQWFGFLDLGKGKDLNSRVGQWSQAFDIIAENFFIGDYVESNLSQKHNTHLDVMTSYGVVPFVLFIVLLCRSTLRISQEAKSSFSKKAFYAFLTVIIQGTFEAALVSGGIGLYIMSFGYLVLAKYKEE